MTGGRGDKLVSVLLQKTQLSRVPVYTEESAVGSHNAYVYRQGELQLCSKLLTIGGLLVVKPAPKRDARESTTGSEGAVGQSGERCRSL